MGEMGADAVAPVHHQQTQQVTREVVSYEPEEIIEEVDQVTYLERGQTVIQSAPVPQQATTTTTTTTREIVQPAQASTTTLTTREIVQPAQASTTQTTYTTQQAALPASAYTAVGGATTTTVTSGVVPTGQTTKTVTTGVVPTGNTTVHK